MTTREEAERIAEIDDVALPGECPSCKLRSSHNKKVKPIGSWAPVQEAINLFLIGFRFDDGTENYHVPTEQETLIVSDVVQGLVGDKRFMGALDEWLRRESAPIYQHRLKRGETWEDCNVADFHVMNNIGRETRILYNHPTPPSELVQAVDNFLKVFDETDPEINCYLHGAIDALRTIRKEKP